MYRAVSSVPLIDLPHWVVGRIIHGITRNAELLDRDGKGQNWVLGPVHNKLNLHEAGIEASHVESSLHGKMSNGVHWSNSGCTNLDSFGRAIVAIRATHF